MSFSSCLNLPIRTSGLSDDSLLTGPNTRDQVALRKTKDHIRVHEITIGVEADLLQVLLRCLVPVAAVVGQREAPRQEPAAEWITDGPNPNAEEHEFDTAQGRKRRQFEYVVGPAQRPAHVVPDDSRSCNDEHAVAAPRAKALAQVTQPERYPLKRNSANPPQAPPPARAEPLCGSLVDCVRGKSRDVVTCPHILRVRAETK